AKVLDVHELEWQQQAGVCVALANLDHAGGEVEPDDVAVRWYGLGEPVAESARPARQVEDALARHQLEPLDQRRPPARLAAGHHLVQPLLIGGRVTTERARV